MALRSTPKVFTSNYQPPTNPTKGRYRSLKPLIGVMVVSGLVVLMSRLPVFTIKEVNVQGTDDQAIIADLESIKGRSIFSQFITATAEQVKAKNIAIAELKCQRGIPDSIRCQVSMRQPALIWRQNNQGWLVDTSGFVYAGDAGTPGLVTVEDRGPSEIKIGQTVTSQELVTSYQNLLKGLADDGYAVTTAFITESLYQVSVVVTGNGQPELAWTPPQPITVLFVTTYSLEAQRQALRQVVIDKKATITERVDLRVPGYAYTK